MKSLLVLLAVAVLFSQCLADEHLEGMDENGDQDKYAEDREWTEKCGLQAYLRKNYTKCALTWTNLTHIQLKEHHRSFQYNFSMPKDKCCHTVHFYPQDMANQVKDEMSCEQKAAAKTGFYQLKLSTDATTKKHNCKVIRDERGNENITCSGNMTFDPSIQRSNNWTMAVSHCGSRDGVELAYFLNFTSEQDKCEMDWHQDDDKHMKDYYKKHPIPAMFHNASKEFTEMRRHYPVMTGGMIAVAAVTGVNSLLLVIGFIAVFVKLNGLTSAKNRAVNYAVANEKVPI